MAMDMDLIRIGVEALTPISIAVFGSVVSYRLKAIDQKQWGAQRLTEKRIEIFEEIAPKINQILCYSILVGQWQQLDPTKVINLKREVDSTIHGNKFILGIDVYNKYKYFRNLVFDTDNYDSGPTRLKIVTHKRQRVVREESEDRLKDNYLFSGETVEDTKIKEAYEQLGEAFITSFNIIPGAIKYRSAAPTRLFPTQEQGGAKAS